MKRRYYRSIELTVVLADPKEVDEDAVRELGRRIVEFAEAEIRTFPWPVDVTFTQTVDRIAEP